jgi:hypothetical protein
MTAILSDIGTIGGWLFLAAVACLVILFSLCVAADKRDERHAATQPSRVIEVGDDTMAMLCPCCTGRPMESDDCTCREDCGVTWCQAADPELEQMLSDWHEQRGGTDG